jgi:hypothetical protein
MFFTRDLQISKARMSSSKGILILSYFRRWSLSIQEINIAQCKLAKTTHERSHSTAASAENFFICNAKMMDRRIDNLVLLETAITQIEQPASSKDTIWAVQTKPHQSHRNNLSNRNTSI